MLLNTYSVHVHLEVNDYFKTVWIITFLLTLNNSMRFGMRIEVIINVINFYTLNEYCYLLHWLILIILCISLLLLLLI